VADDDLLRRLRQFETRFFPRFERHYRHLVDEGQKPRTLFIGCSDSRVVPDLLTGASPGELFVVRNVGNLVPPYDVDGQVHAAAAAIEYAVQKLEVQEIVVCGPSHCGAIAALYGDPIPNAPHLNGWLEHARDAVLPVTVSADALRRPEQRSIILQLERLMTYPMVAERFARGALFLHGWHYLIAEGLNSKIQTVTKAACGFRSFENFKTAIFFHCGGLRLYPVTHAIPG
jgi:carbonic anhydrase